MDGLLAAGDSLEAGGLPHCGGLAGVGGVLPEVAGLP